MKNTILDIAFLISIGLIFIPLFRFNIDIGLFILGVTGTSIILKIGKKGGDDN